MSTFFPLESAYLCPEPDCLTVGNNANACPACANQHGLVSLSGALNRPTLSHEAKEIFRYLPSWKGKVA